MLDNADGVPGVILAAAHLGPELRRDGGGFLDQIARGFERQVLARVAEPAREALGVLSLMSHVGVERDVVGELSIICAAFGADQHSVLDAVETLVAAGFVRLDGSYAEVIPPPLANRLAGRTIRGRAESVRRCFVDLPDAGRARFLQRLLLLPVDEAQRFWEDLLGDQGPFTTLDGLIENSRWFRFAAIANGERAAPALLRLLQIDRLLGASFAVRLKLWVGGWLLDPENTPAPRAAADEAIAGLAREAHQTPSLLTDELVEWLSSGAAQAGKFWFQVGREDIDGIFRPRIRALAATDAGVNAFITYILGWCSRDRDGGRRFFSEVAGAEIATPRAILFGALEIDPPDQGANRIVELLQMGWIDVERMLDPLLGARWLREVSEEDLVRVLRLIAGSDSAGGSQIPHFLFIRTHDTPLAAGPLSDLAWEYLEAHQPTSVHLADFYSDQLAARLAPLDRERAFALLHTTFLDERSEHRWNPLASRPQLSFWHELSRLDRGRALTTLLDATRSHGNARYKIHWHLPNLIDLEADADCLATTRHAASTRR